MLQSEIDDLLGRVEEIFSDPSKYGLLGDPEQTRLTRIRDFLRTLHYLGPQLSQQQQGQLLAELLEALKRD